MKYAVAFVLVMLAGLSFQSLRQEGGRPEDDPVHGTYVAPPKTRAITANRERWHAELDADWAGTFNRRWHEYDAAWPHVTWEQRAWFEVYYQWRDSD